MRKMIWNLVRAAILIAAVAFVLARPGASTVKAFGCPDAGSVGANCTFEDGTCTTYEEHTDCVCYYTCYGGYGSGGEAMYIEQTVYVHD